MENTVERTNIIAKIGCSKVGLAVVTKMLASGCVAMWAIMASNFIAG